MYIIEKNFLWFKEIDLFALKKFVLNQQNVFQLKEVFSLTVYQRNFFLSFAVSVRKYYSNTLILSTR